jgi:antagonist of KipI
VSIHVVRAGLLTTVQDLGRRGHQHHGVPEGGAMDSVALRLANLLIGNAEGAAGLEVTLRGPKLAFDGETLLAIGGADLGASVNGRALRPGRLTRVPDGGTLEFGPARAGCRAYVAVLGGIDVPPVLGSRSTYLPAQFGGLSGRALRRGDVLSSGEPPAAARAPAVTSSVGGAVGMPGIAPSVLPNYGGVVRVVPGPHLGLLTRDARSRLFDSEFRVTPQSDRMGYRLSGPPLAVAERVELLSAGVAFGTVQLPPGADPIVLMADRQTTGGYPRLGEVATVDLPVMAQLCPGDSVRFSEISLAEAQALYLERERTIAALRHALAFSP